jgi:subtilase family serine protease
MFSYRTQSSLLARRNSSRVGRTCRVEQLELRDLLSAAPIASLGETFAQPLLTTLPVDSSAARVAGYSPTQLRQAYGFNQVALNGAGQTIAIVDAYDDPNIAGDLAVFDAHFNLPAPPSFVKVGQTGSITTLPTGNAGWGQEISLDVEWAHAIAPGASILLVEANSPSNKNLLAAVDYARSQPGVVAVSMSFGGAEFSTETQSDSIFTTPAGHTGVAFVAASGDNGAGASWPAISPNVLGVGGTTLKLNSSNNRTTETAWSGSGGGVSSYEPEPSYQSGIQNYGQRTMPDVSYDADPSTGVAVYDSFAHRRQVGWQVFGGTSIAAPQWSALIAIADQGKGASGSLANLPAAVYSLPSSDLYDITSGSNGAYSAKPGYDLVTGLGSPNANVLIPDLIAMPGVVGQLKTGTVTAASAANSSALAAGDGTAAADFVFGNWGSASGFSTVGGPASLGNDSLRHKLALLAMNK